jgi:hypothetical protein
MNDDWAVAVHEAGHCAALFELGEHHQIDHVSIDHRGGRVLHSPLINRSGEQDAFSACVALAAGQLHAQAQGLDFGSNAPDDQAIARALARGMGPGGTGERGALAWQEAERAAGLMVRRRTFRERAERVAEALYRRRYLSGEEVRELLAGARRPLAVAAPGGPMSSWTPGPQGVETATLKFGRSHRGAEQVTVSGPGLVTVS